MVQTSISRTSFFAAIGIIPHGIKGHFATLQRARRNVVVVTWINRRWISKDIDDGGGRHRQKQDSFCQHVGRSLGRCLVACSTVGLQAASCEMWRRTPSARHLGLSALARFERILGYVGVDFFLTIEHLGTDLHRRWGWGCDRSVDIHMDGETT